MMRFATVGIYLGLGLAACQFIPEGPGGPRDIPVIPMNPDEVQLLHITSDATPGVEADYRGVVDADGTLTGFRHLDTRGLKKDFSLAELPTGVVLLEGAGRKVITLISKTFEARTGGPVRLHYLYAGGIFSDDYKDFPIELDHQGGQWLVYKNTNAGRKLITKMLMKKNVKFGQIVGIKEILTD